MECIGVKHNVGISLNLIYVRSPSLLTEVGFKRIPEGRQEWMQSHLQGG